MKFSHTPPEDQTQYNEMLSEKELEAIWGGKSTSSKDDDLKHKMAGGGDDQDDDDQKDSSKTSYAPTPIFTVSDSIGATGQKSYKLQADDDDVGKTLTLGITGKNASGQDIELTAIIKGPNSAQQSFKLTASSQFECDFTISGKGEWTISLSSDNGAGSFTAALIEDFSSSKAGQVQGHPPISSYTSAFPKAGVPEDSKIGTVVGSVSATTQGQTGLSYQFQIVDSQGKEIKDGQFKIQKNGDLILNKALDYETGIFHTLTVRVTDPNSSFQDSTVIVDVADVAGDIGPVGIAFHPQYPSGIPETTAIGKYVGSITASDPDNPSGKLTYQLLDKNGKAIDPKTSPFSVDQKGQITLSSALSAGAAAQYDLTVRVTDSDGNAADQAFSINVAAVDSQLLVGATAISSVEDFSVALPLQEIKGGAPFTQVFVTPGAQWPAGSTVTVGFPPSVTPASFVNGQWVVDLSKGSIDSIMLNSPTDWSGKFDFKVNATNGQGLQTADQSISVDVAAKADLPNLTVVSGMQSDEDKIIALGINASGVDLDHIEISQVPAGASLTQGALLSTASDGTSIWKLTPDELKNLKLQPPKDFNGQLTITVKAISIDGASTAEATNLISVNINPVVDPPNLSVQNVVGAEDNKIPLKLSAQSANTSDTLSHIEIRGLPKGASLVCSDLSVVVSGSDSNGAFYSIKPSQFNLVSIDPPVDFSGTITLSATAHSAVSTGPNTFMGASSDPQLFDIVVTPVADMPSLSGLLPGYSFTGKEDTPMALGFAAIASKDASETLSATISQVPNNYQLTGAVKALDATTWEVTDLSKMADIKLVPPKDVAEKVSLTFNVKSTDGSDSITHTQAVTYEFLPVADTPNLAVTHVTTDEDVKVSLPIKASLNDLDGSESLKIVLTFPKGGSVDAPSQQPAYSSKPELSSIEIDPADLKDLKFTPPKNFSGVIPITVVATSTDGASTSSVSDTLKVSVYPKVDDIIDKTYLPKIITEDITWRWSTTHWLTDLDGSESLDVRLVGVPAGTIISDAQGNPLARDQAGDYIITDKHMKGDMFIQAPKDYSGDLTFKLERTVTDKSSLGKDTKTWSDDIVIDVLPVVDKATISMSATPRIMEEGTISVAASIAVGDSDGSEFVKSIQLGGMHPGFTVSNAAGESWTVDYTGCVTLSEKQLKGLEIKPATHWSGQLNLSMFVVVEDKSPNSSSYWSFSAGVGSFVTPVADAPNLSVNNVSTLEDSAVKLPLSASLVDTDGSESLSVSLTAPTGITLNHVSSVVDNGDGTSTYFVPADKVSQLSLTPPQHYSGSFTVVVKATATENTSDKLAIKTASTTSSFTVDVTPVVDAPNYQIFAPLSSNEDTAIVIKVRSGLVDTDKSETAELTLSNIPTGFSAQDHLGNAILVDKSGKLTLHGDTLRNAELHGITLLPLTHFSGTVNLNSTLTITDSASTGKDIQSFGYDFSVDIKPQADKPQVNITAPAVVREDAPIPLDIQFSLNDKDGSENLANTIKLSGFVDGSTLKNTAGENFKIDASGELTLKLSQLPGLTLTTPLHYAGTLNLSVESTVTDTSKSQLVMHTYAPGDGLALLASTYKVSTADILKWNHIDPKKQPYPWFKVGDSVIILNQDNKVSDTAKFVEDFKVIVVPFADADLVTTSVKVTKVSEMNQAIPVEIKSILADKDGSETQKIVLNGLPKGAYLTNSQGDTFKIDKYGDFTVEINELKGLAIHTPKNFVGDILLSVKSAVSDSVENMNSFGYSQAVLKSISVVDEFKADGLTFGKNNDINVNLPVDTDFGPGTETTLTISGVPKGASLILADEMQSHNFGMQQPAALSFSGDEYRVLNNYSHGKGDSWASLTAIQVDDKSGSFLDTSGKLNALNQNDHEAVAFHSVHLRPGDTYVIDTNGSDFNSMLTLFDDKGVRVAFDNDSGQGDDGKIIYKVPQNSNGEFVIAVNPVLSSAALKAASQDVNYKLHVTNLRPTPTLSSTEADGTTTWKVKGALQNFVVDLPDNYIGKIDVDVHMETKDLSTNTVVTDDFDLKIATKSMDDLSYLINGGQISVAEAFDRDWLPEPTLSAPSSDVSSNNLGEADLDLTLNWDAKAFPDGLTPTVILKDVPPGYRVSAGGQTLTAIPDVNGNYFIPMNPVLAADAKIVVPSDASGKQDINVSVFIGAEEVIADKVTVDIKQPQFNQVKVSVVNPLLPTGGAILQDNGSGGVHVPPTPAGLDPSLHKPLSDYYHKLSGLKADGWLTDTEKKELTKFLTDNIASKIDSHLSYNPKGELNYTFDGDQKDYLVTKDGNQILVTDKANPQSVIDLQHVDNLVFKDGVIKTADAADVKGIPLDFSALNQDSGRLIVASVPDGASIAGAERGVQNADGTYDWAIDLSTGVGASGGTDINIPLGFLGDLDVKMSYQAEAGASAKFGGSLSTTGTSISAQGEIMYSAAASAGVSGSVQLGMLSAGASASVSAEVKMGVSGSLQFDLYKGLSAEAYAGAIASMTAAAEAKAGIGSGLQIGVSGQAGVTVGMEAQGSSDVGWSLDKLGVAAQGGAFFGASAGADGSYTYSLGPVTTTVSGGVSVGGFGASAGGSLLYEDGKLTIGVSGALSCLIGIEIDIQITIDFNKIIDIAKAIADKVVEVGKAILDGLITVGNAIKDGFITAANAIKDGFITAANAIKDGFIAMGHAIADGFITAAEAVVEFGEKAVKAVAKAFTTAAKAVADFFSDLTDDCFITSAVMRSIDESIDEADNGYTLTMLRAFRDEHMLTNEVGKQQVGWYYEHAPFIVTLINHQEQSDDIYREMYYVYLIPAVTAIEQNRLADASKLYQALIVFAKQRAEYI